MRNTLLLIVALFVAATGAAAQRETTPAGPPDDVLGKWSGTWDGAGSGGGFDITFEKPKDGPATGKVSVTGEPAYTATLKTMSFEGNKKMTGKYDFPSDESMEVVLALTFDGSKASGSWSLRQKAGGTEIVSGGLSLTKK